MRYGLVVGVVGTACMWAAAAPAEVTRSQCLDLLVMSETVREQAEDAMQGLNTAIIPPSL